MTSDDSITATSHSARADTTAPEPILLVVGSNTGCDPGWNGRVVGFCETLVVGRRATEDPSVSSLALRDSTLSSRHLSISKTRTGEFELRDLGSTNGTLVNGELVRAPLRVRDGAVIFAGGHVMVLRTASPGELEAVAAESASPLGPVATVNPRFALSCQKMRLLAPTREHVLLVGETGTGKETYARAIHHASGRKGELVTVDCAAMSPSLVDTELFGTSERRGLFERAEGGTLFLDEVGELEARVLTKLLRLTEQEAVTPVWGARAPHIDVRIIAATSRTVPSGDANGLGRDLAVRFGSEPIWIPPLRDRIEDVGALAHTILGGCDRSFEPAAFQALCLYPWPGNVRELRNTLVAAGALAQGSDRIGLEHLPSGVSAPPRLRTATRRRRPRPAPTAQELEHLLRRHRGNVLRVSRELDRKPAVVYRWARRFGLQVTGFRSAQG